MVAESLKEQVMCLPKAGSQVPCPQPWAQKRQLVAVSSKKKKNKKRHVRSLLGQHMKPGSLSLFSAKQSLESDLDRLTQLYLERDGG